MALHGMTSLDESRNCPVAAGRLCAPGARGRGDDDPRDATIPATHDPTTPRPTTPRPTTPRQVDARLGPCHLPSRGRRREQPRCQRPEHGGPAGAYGPALGTRPLGTHHVPATLLPREHPSGPPAQLLDHRPHRPREVHARGPAARVHPHDRSPADDQPGPRLHGPGAREGDHHQGACRSPGAHGGRRPGLRPQPHRHAGSRGLQLRGEPEPPGLRGRDPGGRRRAGDRGPDAGQRPPRAPPGPGDHPGAQQDRPAVGPARPGHRGAGERARHSPRGGPPGLGEGGDRHPRDPRSDRRPRPAAEGKPDSPPPGPCLRLPLRPVQGRRDLRPAGRRDAPCARADPADGLGRGGGDPGARLLPAPARAREGHDGRRGGLHRDGPQERPRRAGRRHGHERGRARGRAASRLPGRQEPGLRGDLPDLRGGLPPLAGRDGEAAPQRRQLHLRARELHRPRVRVPLRLPRPAPHGDRPGAPRARVRPRADRVRPVGGVPGHAHGRQGDRGRGQPGPACHRPATSR